MTDTEVERIVVEVVRRLLAAERTGSSCASTHVFPGQGGTGVPQTPVFSREDRRVNEPAQVHCNNRPDRIIPTTSLSSIGGVSGLPMRLAAEVPPDVLIQETRVSEIACESGPLIARTSRAKNDPCAAWRIADDTLACDDPLLTLGKFAGGLEGIRRLVVAPKAIVTPSLKEELNRRGIEVDRRASGRAPQAVRGYANKPVAVVPVVSQPACGRLLLVEFDCSQKNHWAKAIAQAVGTIDHLACGSLSQTLDTVAKHVSCGDQLAVVLTRHPAAVACAANRTSAVRAAATSSLDGVAMVSRSMAANVLTIDPARHSRFALQAMTKQFLKAPKREIRSELEGMV